ncbi:anti-sigma factor family protein [Lacisediminihabitans profunda]|uniref:Anti-sigma factor n=1 Tax=Lacisediminihabitans profunda TaxID=2594790 RepID=A0A5C8UIU7_9MICO|nr:zf-HC2 domain-containing protein [Lacisediminihabitans profunda]TXN28097.1 anti-sigma factor [Lacisediminihabitans profunda]
MNPVDLYAEWDAAYVLGALSPLERREFERHLATCGACAAGVAELAGLPGLLAKVPAADLEMVAPVEDSVPPTLLPRLVRSAARRRRRSRGLVAGAIVATAAAAAAVALAIPLAFAPPAQTPAASGARVSLSQVIPTTLSAKALLVEESWGTRIEMQCTYAAPASTTTSGYGVARRYEMFVTDSRGNVSQVATWSATPGSTVEPSGTTSLRPSEIATVDVRSADGRVLLTGRP